MLYGHRCGNAYFRSDVENTVSCITYTRKNLGLIIVDDNRLIRLIYKCHQCVIFKIFVTVSLQVARQSAVRQAFFNVSVNRCVDVSLLVFRKMVNISNIYCNILKVALKPNVNKPN